MRNFTNVDVFTTDWTGWQDMGTAARDYVTEQTVHSFSHEDDDGEPLVTHIMPAGSLAHLQTL